MHFGKFVHKVLNHPSPLLQSVSNGLYGITRLERLFHIDFNSRFEAKSPIAFYDCRYLPVTYDFSYFLYAAACYFFELGFGYFDLIIVDIIEARGWELESGYASIIKVEQKRRRIYDMLLPIASLFKECRNISVLNDLSQVKKISLRNTNIFPSKYNGYFYTEFDYKYIYEKAAERKPFVGIVASKSDTKNVQSWLKRNNIRHPYVTFTLRSYRFQPERNPDPELYRKLADYLTLLEFNIVIIPDCDNLEISSFLDVFPICYQAAFSVVQRNAIYESAFTNFFPGNGPASLASLNNNTSFIVHNFVNKYWTREMHMKRGLLFGDQPWAGDRGIWVWSGDSFDSLMKAFEAVRHMRMHTASAIQ